MILNNDVIVACFMYRWSCLVISHCTILMRDRALSAKNGGRATNID